ARDVNAENLDTLLFLGNAYFSLNRYGDAINVWESYVSVAGGTEKAGRVPSLIETAKARLTDPTTPLGSGAVTENGMTEGSPFPLLGGTGEGNGGGSLYAAHCAACHGVNGEGGSGPVLAGNARAADIANAENIITYGRGLMPGFGAMLSPEQIEAVTQYVAQELAQ
ncbi:MAG: c-type cytochrome, partial [Trueperaceae bacterium]